jgi:8-oxo-dGTP pyrophosphatase MutT (NUDIX family)
MSAALPKICDHTSVGVIVTNHEGAFALLKRARFPVGIAPVAGHIDQHGTPEQAAVAEVQEEIGLIVAIKDLQQTTIQGKRYDNHCRRQGGDHHNWWVYTTDTFEGEIQPDPDETRGASWYSLEQLQSLVERTRAFQAGRISQADWEAYPGLEEIWVSFLLELGYSV